LNIAATAWLLIAIAIVAANLPFVNERLFALLPLKAPRKSFSLRGLELVVLYFAVGLLARAMEAHIGNVQSQRWEFYAISACMFLVFAYPGFVHRYMRRRTSSRRT